MSNLRIRIRQRTPAELAADAVRHAQAQADAWGSHSGPRRPRLGHVADCPDNGRPLPRRGFCRFCRAEALAASVPQIGADPHRNRPRHPEPEQRSCSSCYAPTTNPDTCNRCGGTP